MGCKHTTTVDNSSPHTSKRETRWRFVARINIQIGLVDTKLSDFRNKNLQEIDNKTYNKNPSLQQA